MSTGESTQSTESLAAQGNAFYEVNINMSQQTVQALTMNGYSLYGFKAVQAHQGGGAPLVWLASRNIYPTMEVSWASNYQAYTSNSQIIPNGQIMMMFNANIGLGQTLEIQNGGMGQVSNQGTPGAISFLNQGSTQFTTGLAQPVNNDYAPYCAFPLYGNMLGVVAPVEQVLLMFSTLPVNTGTVIEQAFSSGILIDLTSASQRTVSFDINTGWSWGGTSWARNVPANSSLVPLLIQS
jgi:hypothetical protein